MQIEGEFREINRRFFYVKVKRSLADWQTDSLAESVISTLESLAPESRISYLDSRIERRQSILQLHFHFCLWQWIKNAYALIGKNFAFGDFPLTFAM